MEILCKTNVPTKYRCALNAEEWATVRVTTDFLRPDAEDIEIAEFAAERDYVLLVRDEDFSRW